MASTPIRWSVSGNAWTCVSVISEANSAITSAALEIISGSLVRLALTPTNAQPIDLVGALELGDHEFLTADKTLAQWFGRDAGTYYVWAQGVGPSFVISGALIP